jgi:hypothetical protein
VATDSSSDAPAKASANLFGILLVVLGLLQVPDQVVERLGPPADGEAGDEQVEGVADTGGAPSPA